jgi:hypothetical protein
VATSKDYKELRMTKEQTKDLEDMEDNIKNSQHEIIRAEKAGIDMKEQRLLLDDIIIKRKALLDIYRAK